MTTHALSPRPAKAGVRKLVAPSGRPIAYRDVLRALERDEARQRTLAAYRSGGFTADEFHRLVGARSAMVEALVSIEDWVEAEHPAWRTDRVALRDVRRRLEAEVHP